MAWVHPTWRDLVIERLGADPARRRRFLTHCGVHGIVLALSVAGGAGGGRQLPLLVSDADWDAVGDRLHALTPELETRELLELLETLTAMLDELDPATGAGEPPALAGLVLTRTAARWDAAGEPIPLPVLDAWLRLAGRLESPPAPPSLGTTWAELLPARTPDPEDTAEVQRFTDWLILCGLLAPPQLAALGWGPGQMASIADFVDRVGGDPPRFATDAVIQALEATARLHPELGGRARRLITMVLAPEMSETHAGEAQRFDEPAPAEAFDIDRVLADL